MKYISIFDIVGPSMVGPSSSHTAGAVRLGLLARKIYGKKPSKVRFTLYNSFAKTGKGHGTDKGLLGGILGFNVNDPEIKNAFRHAADAGLDAEFVFSADTMRHPNAVDIDFLDEFSLSVSGNSVGAGEILVTSVDNYNVRLRGDLPTLILIYKDQPGMIWRVTKVIQTSDINIATLSCERKEKGQTAFMSICLDGLLPEDKVREISEIPGMYMVRNVEALEK